MTSRPLVEPYVSQWLAASASGKSLPLAELCSECPELIPEVAKELHSRGVPFFSLPDIDSADAKRIGVDLPTPVPRPWLELAPEKVQDSIGSLGGYQLVRILGEGGMGTVYLAYDQLARRQIALKTMRPEIAMRPQARERFLREARSAAALDHENIVPIYQVSEDRNIPFIAMPFLNGESLEARLFRDRTMSASWVMKVAREVASGLSLAHEHGVIHRDIKPANLFLSVTGRNSTSIGSGKYHSVNDGTENPDELRFSKVKILDFGLARPVEATENFTLPGMLIGTPGYMSPEQIDGLPLDPRSDLFSLGCVLYQMATGESPFMAQTLTGVLLATAEREPTPVCQLNPDIPQSFGELIHRLLAKKRENRPENAQEVVDIVRIIEESSRVSNKTFASTHLKSPTQDLEPITLHLAPPESNSSRPLLILGLIGVILFGIILLVINLKRKPVDAKVSTGNRNQTEQVQPVNQPEPIADTSR